MEMETELTYPTFKKDMKKTHTILIPSMLPIHFKLIEGVLKLAKQ